METYESVILGIVAILAIFIFFPGMKQRMQSSPKADASDWKALLFPLALVALFVMFLISIV